MTRSGSSAAPHATEPNHNAASCGNSVQTRCHRQIRSVRARSRGHPEHAFGPRIALRVPAVRDRIVTFTHGGYGA